MLPSPQSDLAQQTIKNPYLFDFIALSDDVMEKDIENPLTEHIQWSILKQRRAFMMLILQS